MGIISPPEALGFGISLILIGLADSLLEGEFIDGIFKSADLLFICIGLYPDETPDLA